MHAVAGGASRRWSGAWVRALAGSVAGVLVVTACSIVDQPDGGTAATTDLQTFDVQPTPSGDYTYRVSKFTFTKPSNMVDNTDFGTLAGALLTLAIQKSVPNIVGPLNLLVRIKNLDSGSPIYEMCQAHPIHLMDGGTLLPVDDDGSPNDGYQCHGLPFMPLDSPATFKNGQLTVQPFLYTMDIAAAPPTPDSFLVYLDLQDLSLQGTFNKDTGFDGVAQFKIRTRDLCAAPVQTDMLCQDTPQPDGRSWSNLLDMIDGPKFDGMGVKCGQDGSADWYHPVANIATGAIPAPATCATGTDSSHYPPDTIVMVNGVAEPAYSFEAKFGFKPAKLYDGQGKIPLPPEFGRGQFCTMSPDIPCDLPSNREWYADAGP
jgi:hypothetical protein